MAGQTNAAPVIIKRKKVIQAAGHHGGAWKVAYADFVTAMMAFFMLMWLMNATTEKQRKGIAEFFNPTIPVNRISGGGDGALAGNSIFAEETLIRNGTGAVSPDHAREPGTGSQPGSGPQEINEKRESIEKALLARSGESMTMERMMRHVVTRVSDQGLVIELFDLPESPLFLGDTAQPGDTARQIARVLTEILPITGNAIAVDGHVHSYPIILIDNPEWTLSTARAQALRDLLESGGLDRSRFARVTGHAARKPATADPSAVRNNRIEVILLRGDT